MTASPPPFPGRKKIIAGNWKMNHGPQATRDFFSALTPLLVGTTPALNFRAQLYVPTVSLFAALESSQLLRSSTGWTITIGAQNAHYAPSGAFTGETSGPMLKEIGIHHVLLGHSERRQFFGETDSSIHDRALSLLHQGFEVMICLGESRAEREAGTTEHVLHTQWDALTGASLDSLRQAILDGKLAFAYEPIWAIGTGLTASPEQAEAAHAFIRKCAAKNLGDEYAEKLPILYGGSVTSENLGRLCREPHIDGALIGGASLKPEGWAKLLTTLPA